MTQMSSPAGLSYFSKKNEVKEKPKRKDRIDDESKDVLGSKWDIGMSLCMYVKRN